MEAPLTEYHQSQTEQPGKSFQQLPDKSEQAPQYKSQQLVQKIYNIINSPRNQKEHRPYKLSISLDETPSTVTNKCNCKKSKCLKLYCECFAQGSFCKDCNCTSCQNTEQFSQIRAKAIDQVLIRAAIPFGHKNSSIKGCNCKKTGCQKKYCQCFGAGDKCNQYCKCSNCQNC